MKNLNTLENIRDVFAIFHDGEIEAHCGDFHRLRLTIKCEYLAEKIDTSFSAFYVDIFDITNLFFSTWPNPITNPTNTFTNLEDMFKADLTILSSSIENEKVKIICNQTNSSFNYCGGELFISGRDIIVFDEAMNKISISQLDILCNSYWNNFNKPNNGD